MSLSVTIVPVTPYQQNCSIVKCNATGKAAVVDPGGDIDRIKAAIEKMGATVEKILLTHAHLDHVLGCAGMVGRHGLHPQLFPEDGPTYEMAPRAAEMYGVPMDPLPSLHPEPLVEGRTLTFGDLNLEVCHAPGHAPGHVVLIDHAARRVVGGDVLFRGSVGRTDLPGGDAEALAQSIERVLYTLPDDYAVWPGHGPETTIGEEKAGNPFVNAAGSGMMQR